MPIPISESDYLNKPSFDMYFVKSLLFAFVSKVAFEAFLKVYIIIIDNGTGCNLKAVNSIKLLIKKLSWQLSK